MNRANFVEFYNRLLLTKTRYAECVKVVRADGAIFRFTAHDTSLHVQEDDGQLYEYIASEGFKITALENSRGLAVTNMNIGVIVNDDTITDNDLRAGLFDNARVEIFLLYWNMKQYGKLPLRTAWIGELTTKKGQFSADLRGIAQRLQQVFTKVTSLECRWIFCDTRCGLDKDTYSRTTTVIDVEANDIFSVNLLPNDRNKFQWGLIEFTTGANAGLSMEIMREFNGRLQLFLPMSYDVAVGNQVKLTYGCDKIFKTCDEVFDNAINFGGEPFMTGSDFIASYPTTVKKDDEDDGGKF